MLTALSFATGAVHTLQMNSEDRGASLTGFDNNRALGALTVGGTVQVSSVVYTWRLSGSGVARVAPGGCLYYVTNENWTGSIALDSGGSAQRVPVMFGSIAPQPPDAMRLTWPSAFGFSVGVEWTTNLVEGAFLAATNFVASGSNSVWDDLGDTNRPPPGVATQRFYRLWISP